MIDFLINSPILLLVIGTLIVLILLFIFIKPSNKKRQKKNTDKKKIDDKSNDKKTDSDEKTEQDLKEETIKKKVRRVRKKPEITQIYKRMTNLEQTPEASDINQDKDDLVSRAQFVKTGSKVSKLVGFSDIVEEELKVAGSLSEMPVEDFKEDCEDCKKQVKHFDHSIRLSKIVNENGFDDVLQRHISDKYLNIHAEKHVMLGEKFEEKLFDRTLKTLSNSSSKLLVDEVDESFSIEKLKSDRDYRNVWLEERRKIELANLLNKEPCLQDGCEHPKRIFDDLNLSPKNIIAVEAITKRKSLKRNINK